MGCFVKTVVAAFTKYGAMRFKLVYLLARLLGPPNIIVPDLRITEQLCSRLFEDGKRIRDSGR
jgi:hypothetical protein